MEKQRFIELIDKYLSGTATEAEQRLVEEYLNRMEAKDGTQLSQEQEEHLKEAMWQHIQLQTTQQPAKVVQMAWYKRKIVRLTAAVAAACVLIILFIWRPWESSFENGNFQIITVAQGEPIRKVMLADSTLIWVKPNSQLTYPTTFSGNLREINLEGEALFEVAKDATHPFIVHCDNTDVRVVGTSFHIKDTKDKDIVEIAVLTGKVQVTPLHQEATEYIELLPTHRLTINRKNGKIEKTVFDSAEPYTAGTAYDMRFVNTPLDSISMKIEEKFGVVIETDTQNNSGCRISGDFTDQPLSHTIDVLCKTLGATYTMKPDTIRISGLNCK
ncbi:MAG: FecR family protein [Flavisolibacter sp.]|nr:FecR family protein [Flavisolibacter sp.]